MVINYYNFHYYYCFITIHFNPFITTRYPTSLKKIQLAFCNPYSGVKTISRESFPHMRLFSENFVGHWCPSGWKRLFFSLSLRIF